MKQKPDTKPVTLDITKTVKKSNILNELRDANASLVEYRLFCVYLAHLPMNSADNVVTFSLADYARIAGLDRPRHDDIEAQSNRLLDMKALIRNDDGGFTNRNLFAEFRLFKEDDQWMVSMECTHKIAPMIREQRGRFLRYKLYNTIYLKSFNQQRIYELLKQYESVGVRTESLEDLRAYLSIGEKEYPVWYDFSSKVLKVAQNALKESTDICFDYEPVKKNRKTVGVKFTIFRNEQFIDKIRVEEFAPRQEVAIEYEGEGFTVHHDEDPDQMNVADVEALIAEEDAAEERKQSFRDIHRQARMDLVCPIFSERNYSDDDIEEIVVAAEQSEWWQHVFTDMLASVEDKNRAFHDYVEAKYLYCKTRTEAKTKNGFMAYFTKGLRENYGDYELPTWARPTEGSFDPDDFYAAALRRSGFDPNDL